jgi:DNA-binding transcriptional LysR family regulator
MQELDWYLQINLKARHLRLLVAIDTYRNLTQVADVTHVTVPAVSKSLKELERGIGLPLFTRGLHGLTPTPYGECLIRHAKSMINVLQKARDELKALSSGTKGKVRIGMLAASASVILPHALGLLKQRSAGTNATVNEGNAETLLPELWQGQLDLVVGRLPTSDSMGNFQEKELLEEPVVVMTGPHHPLAQKKSVKWSDLQHYPWILPPVGSMLRDPLERVLEANHLSLSTNYIETLSIHVARTQLHSSDFITVMSRSIAKDSTHPLHIVPLELPRMMRPVGVLWNRNRELSPSALLMLECLNLAAKQIQEEGVTRTSLQSGKTKIKS